MPVAVALSYVTAAARLHAQTVDSVPDTVAARAVDALVRAGFADVAAVSTDGRLVARFENTRFRDDRRAMREAAQILRPLAGEAGELELVPTRLRIPLMSVRYGVMAGDAAAPASPPRVSLDLSDVPGVVLKDHGASSPAGRVDVVIRPFFEASFGAVDNPIASRTGISPEARVLLRPGLVLSASALLTLQDDLPTGDSPVRPLVATLSQTVRLPGNVFASASAGMFSSDRYGADLEARIYSNDALWMAGAEVGMTGGSSFTRGQWGFSPVAEQTVLVDVARRIPRYDLTVRATAGAFMGDDHGVRLDVIRRFGELDIGWFALATQDGANGGLTLRIPLPQTRYGRPAPARLRFADGFRWQYRYHGLVSGGRRFNTGYVLEDLGRALDLGPPQDLVP